MRKLKIIAGALGAALSLTGQTPAQEMPRPASAEPARTATAESLNQRMANAIAGYLQASGKFKGCQIEVAYANGLADIWGQVNDPIQRAEAIHIVRTVPGVGGVRERIMVGSASAVMPAQGAGPALGPPPGLEGPPPVGGTGLPEPLSIMPMPPIPNPAHQPPPMPPYAWPTTAPYNNFSRVAYPTLYPYEAWPFIGPMYPFPKVPPGWRSVKLTWQDGHWWYGREATGHDWWRVRYR